MHAALIYRRWNTQVRRDSCHAVAGLNQGEHHEGGKNAWPVFEVEKRNPQVAAELKILLNTFLSINGIWPAEKEIDKSST